MAQIERSISDLEGPRPGAQGVLRAALVSFDRHGFASASIRTIAAEAGLSVSVIYHYFTDKQELLFQILETATEDIATAVDKALAISDSDPTRRLRSVVRVFASFYTERQAECRVMNREVRHLDGDRYALHLARRRRLQQVFEVLVQEGVDEGTFAVPDVTLAAREIVVMCRDIANWFDPKGPMSAAQVAETYTELALQLVGCAPIAPAKGMNRDARTNDARPTRKSRS